MRERSSVFNNPHSIVNPKAGAQSGQRFRLVTLDRYRQRYRKFQAAVVSFEETVSENRPLLPLKDRRHEAFKDGFCRNTVVDTIRHVPTRSRQSLRTLCYASEAGKLLCDKANALEALLFRRLHLICAGPRGLSTTSGQKTNLGSDSANGTSLIQRLLTQRDSPPPPSRPVVSDFFARNLS